MLFGRHKSTINSILLFCVSSFKSNLSALLINMLMLIMLMLLNVTAFRANSVLMYEGINNNST